MTTLTEDFEGVGDGVGVTTGNTSFGFVDSASSTIEGDTAHAAHGSASGRFATTASAAPYARWQSGISGTTAWARVYARLGATPGSDFYVARLQTAGSANMGAIRLNAAGTVTLIYGAAGVGGTTTATYNVGSWFRVEVSITTSSTTGGAGELRLYNDPDSETATEVETVSGVSTGSDDPITRCRFGIVTAVASLDINLDDPAFSDSDWPGSAAPPAAAAFVPQIIVT